LGFFAQIITRIMEYKGVLIPIGGNEDKGEGKEDLGFIKDSILSKIVKESGGTDAKIVVIPTASQIPDEVGQNYLEAFDSLGCKNVKVLDIRSREDAEKAKSIELIKEADCIMFSGGDQSRIVKFIGKTKIHQILHERYINEPVVIAGTSAGAMCMSSEMISSGSSTESLIKGSVKMKKGMDFMPGLIIDSHFIKRGRFGRLSEAVARHPKLLGVGLAENTGIIIRNRNQCKVIGSGMVIVFDGRNLEHNNFKILEKDTPMTMTNLKVHVLANSDSYELSTHKVSVLPMGASFE